MEASAVVVHAARALGIDPACVQGLPGASRETWGVGDHILRVRPRQALLAELAAIAAAKHVLPVPRVLATADLGGMAAALFDRLSGVPAGQLDGLSQTEARQRGLQCGRLHALMTRIRAPTVLPDADPAGRTENTDAAAMRLVHLDLHPFNVLIAEDGQVAGVLDWANAARGRPDLDRARTLSILTLDPAAVRRRADPRWVALSEGWITGGELTDVPTAARAWAYNYMLADLEHRYAAADLAHVRAAIDEIKPSRGI